MCQPLPCPMLPGLDLEGAEALAVFVGDQDVHVRHSCRGLGGNPAPAEQLAEDIMFACRTNDCWTDPGLNRASFFWSLDEFLVNVEALTGNGMAMEVAGTVPDIRKSCS